MSAHTKEPWEYDGNQHILGPPDPTSLHEHGRPELAVMLLEDDASLGAEQYANARRIVAAVNAVAGIPTEALEAGVVKELVAAICEPHLLDALHPEHPVEGYAVDRLRAVIAVLAKVKP